MDPDPECDEEGWGTARAAAAPVAVAVALGGAYVGTYGLERFFDYVTMLGEYGVVVQFGVLAAVVAAHEAIHAVAYAVLCGLSRDEVAVEAALFPDGSLDPLHVSVHPDRAVRRWRYAVGVAAPGVLLGLVPSAVGLATDNPLAAFVGLYGVLLVATDVPALVEAWTLPDYVAASDPARAP